MKKFTHETFSLAIFLTIGNIAQFSHVICLIGGILTVFFSILNDVVDFKMLGGYHRNYFTHSLINPLWIMCCIICTIALNVFVTNFEAILLSINFTIPIFYHVILDALNPTGIFIIPGKKVSLNKWKSDDFMPNATIQIISLITISINFVFLLDFG